MMRTCLMIPRRLSWDNWPGETWNSAGREKPSDAALMFPKLLTKEITKIINVTPMLRHNYAGVAGNLYGLAVGSVDNTMRFENNPQVQQRMARHRRPEIYNLPALADRVVLNIVDALISQMRRGHDGTVALFKDAE